MIRKVQVEQTSKEIKRWQIIAIAVGFLGAILVILSWGGLPTFYLGLLLFGVGAFLWFYAMAEQWWEHG